MEITKELSKDLVNEHCLEIESEMKNYNNFSFDCKQDLNNILTTLKEKSQLLIEDVLILIETKQRFFF